MRSLCQTEYGALSAYCTSSSAYDYRSHISQRSRQSWEGIRREGLSGHGAEENRPPVSKAITPNSDLDSQAHRVESFKVSGNGGREEPSFLLDTSTKLVNDARLANALLLRGVRPVDWISMAVKVELKKPAGIGPP